MALDPDKHRLSEAEHQAIFERNIKPDLFADAKPSSQPVAVIFGGQPGAGKSVAVYEAMNELSPRGGAVQIIGDDLRDYHPKYARLMKADDKTAAFYTDYDTGKWVEKAIAEAKAQRVNIVIEGTMRDGNKVADTMQSLRAAGYQIDARALAVNSRLSEQGIMQRYEGQKADRGAGRMTMLQAHQKAYDGMLQTLDRIEGQKLADRVTIYRRGAVTIYSNELQGGQWVREPQARAVVEAERERAMTLEETHQFAEDYGVLVRQLEEPRRNATAAEKAAMRSLHEQAVTLHQSAKEMSDIVKDLQAKPLPGGLSAVVVLADPQASHLYHGKIIAATEHHALQQVGANKFVIHERSKAGQQLQVGKSVTIGYGASIVQPEKTRTRGITR